MRNIRYAVRTLSKSPGFTVVAVLTLALGIGANTAMFSALNAFLLRPLPFRNPGRLVMLWETNPKLDNFMAEGVPTCLQNYLDWQDQAKSFSGMAALKDTNLNLTGVDKPEQLEVNQVSPNFFDLMGVKAASGRTFAAGEGEPGKNRVVVLSPAFFAKRFGQNTGLSGKAISLNGVSYAVIGILPHKFHPASLYGGLEQNEAEVFIPLNVSRSQSKADLQNRRLWVYARLKPSVRFEQARAEMQLIGKRLQQKDPALNAGFGANMQTITSEDVGGSVRLALIALQFAVGFVLLIACANLANLLLARAAGREKETAVRMALGARRGQIMRQFLTESMVLSVMGGFAGLLLAEWGIAAINRYAPKDMLGAHTLQLDFRVFGFTFLIVALAGLLFGSAPAIHSLRQNINASLMSTARSVVGRSGKTRSALVIIEVMLAVILLVGAGLAARSLNALRHVNPGFTPDHLLTAIISLPQEKYQKPEQLTAFCEQLLEKVQALPGVRSAALTSGLPMESLSATGFHLEGQTTQWDSDYLIADQRFVSEDYFAVMGQPLLRGRAFTRAEAAEPKSQVVIINESMAKKFWPGQDAIGKVIIFGKKEKQQPMTIVGIVGDSIQLALDTPPQAEMYRPGRSFSQFGVAVRTAGDPMQLTNGLTAAVLAIDKDQPVAEIHTMQELVDGSVEAQQFGTWMMLIFAMLAVALSSIGLYGVLSYVVSQRTQEIGIRLALGAPRAQVLRMVVRQGMTLAVIGLGIGLVGSLIIGRTISSLLYGIKPADSLTLIWTAVLLFLISLLASYLPARRATKVDPMVALRYE